MLFREMEPCSLPKIKILTMKKLLLISNIIFTLPSLAQNTFPTSGNTGIFTTTPSAALHVKGTVRIDSAMTVQDSINVNGRTRTFELIVQGESKFVGDVVMKSGLKVDSTIKAKSDLIIDGETKMHGDAKAFENFTVDGISILNGNVKMEGLTATEPDTLLNLLVLTPTGQVKLVDFTNIYNLYKTVGLVPCSATDVAMPQWYFNVNKLYTPGDPVKVGIGTENPTHKLTTIGTSYSRKFLAGNQTASENALFNGYAENTGQDLLILGRKIGLIQSQKFKVSNNGAVQISKNGANTAFTILNGTGHAVAVKDDAMNSILQLQNDGLLKVRKIRVDLEFWSDYVFEEGYQFHSLEQTEAFVLENKHLPGVPSEEQLCEEGVDLVQMQQIQMEKTEEIYLHLFEMNKRMETLQLQMEQLLKENAELKAKIGE